MVDSEFGKGTTVRIYVPAIRRVPAQVSVNTIREDPVPLSRGEGTVLVIEDEVNVMEVTINTLERFGYRVLAAETGANALETVRTDNNPIHVALLDIKLPDMTGAQLYLFLMDARPGLEVIIFSGYKVDGPARQILDAEEPAFIQKLFSVPELAEKLNEVSGRESSRPKG